MAKEYMVPCTEQRIVVGRMLDGKIADLVCLFIGVCRGLKNYQWHGPALPSNRPQMILAITIRLQC